MSDIRNTDPIEDRYTALKTACILLAAASTLFAVIAAANTERNAIGKIGSPTIFTDTFSPMEKFTMAASYRR